MAPVQRRVGGRGGSGGGPVDGDVKAVDSRTRMTAEKMERSLYHGLDFLGELMGDISLQKVAVQSVLHYAVKRGLMRRKGHGLYQLVTDGDAAGDAGPSVVYGDYHESDATAESHATPQRPTTADNNVPSGSWQESLPEGLPAASSSQSAGRPRPRHRSRSVRDSPARLRSSARGSRLRDRLSARGGASDGVRNGVRDVAHVGGKSGNPKTAGPRSKNAKRDKSKDKGKGRKDKGSRG